MEIESDQIGKAIKNIVKSEAAQNYVLVLKYARITLLCLALLMLTVTIGALGLMALILSSVPAYRSLFPFGIGFGLFAIAILALGFSQRLWIKIFKVEKITKTLKSV